MPQQCPRCGGRGIIDDNQGFFSFSQPCPQCGGTGVIIEEPCPTCHGSGTELRARQVKVRIPPGVQDGQRIRLKGRGGPGRNGGPNGDLYVITKVEPHPLFGRRENDLTVTVPITFAEAALGAEVKVPTLDGSPVKIKVPQGTRSGRTFRVKGRGVPAAKRSGDLLVTVEVAVPAKLSADERKAVEALAAAATESPRAHLGV
jgi:molecular chaperone DnaJ